MQGYHVKKHSNRWGVFQKNILLSLHNTEAEADAAMAKYLGSKPQDWKVSMVEKANRAQLQELLDDGFEPYAVDDRFHYLKKQGV